MFESLFLGLVQGLTEFLPVSSSGHLAIFQNILGLELESSLPYELVLHIATALATLIFFRKDIIEILFGWFRGLKRKELRTSDAWRLGSCVLIGSVLTAIIGLSTKGLPEAISQDVAMVGMFLCVTGAILLATKFAEAKRKRITYSNSAFIGLVQGIATLPGISRSGSTIASAIFMGIDKEEAFKFSFLLSIPAICGACLLEFCDLGTEGFMLALPEGWWLGAMFAFAIGYLSLALLKKLVIEAKWHYFGIYCFIIGIIAIVY